jgi:hypothetical protein
MARDEGKLVRAGLKLAELLRRHEREGGFSLLRCGGKCLGMMGKQVFLEILREL